MGDGSTTIPAYIDFTPNLLKQPGLPEDQKRRVAEQLGQQVRSRIDDRAIDRWAALPALMVRPGEYCTLLVEARDLFIQGFFYSCVAMCGIAAERIAKDAFVASLLVRQDSHQVPPSGEAASSLESLNAKEICEFLMHAGIVDKKLRRDFRQLGELRNKYAHGGGKNHEQDARAAIQHLHAIVEGTVSILKDYEFRRGGLVRKRKGKP